MPSPFSVPLLAALRGYDLDTALLLEITFADPSAYTLRASHAEVFAPAGTRWGPLISSSDPIDAPGAFMSAGFDQVTWGFTLYNAPILGGITVGDLFWKYRAIGATVVAYLWSRRATDLGQIFSGVISTYRASRTVVRVKCLQRRDWNRELAPIFVDRGAYPRAPEKSIGAPIPLLWGDGTRPLLRGEWMRAVGTGWEQFTRIGGAIPSAQGVLVDTGRGGGGANPKARVLFASHQCATVCSPTVGADAFIKASDISTPSVVLPAGGDIINSTTECGFDIPDGATVGKIGVLGIDIKAGVANPADNPRAVLDVTNETRYALLDYDALNRDLRVLLPTIESPGQFVGAEIVVAYMSFGAIGGIQFNFINNATGFTQTFTPVINTFAFGAAAVGAYPILPASPWNFGDCEIQIAFTGGASAGVKFRVYSVGLSCQYVPKQQLVKVVKGYRTEPFTRPPRTTPRREPKRPGRPPRTPYRTVEFDASITELDGDFFGALAGRKDSGAPVNVDAAGTYTGLANSLIERAPDIAHSMLRNYCGQGAGAITTGAGSHGSFVDARAHMKTWSGSDMRFWVAIESVVGAEEALASLAENSLSWIFLSRFDDLFKWVSWREDPAVDYGYTIQPEDVLDSEMLSVDTIADTRLATSVRVVYLWDPYRKAYLGDCALSHSRSTSGYEFLNLRDELLTVTANLTDRLDFFYGVAYSAFLTPGDYAPMAFAQHVAARMKAVAGGYDFMVSWGCEIVAGYNDKIDLDDGAVKVATIQPGQYATFDALGLAIVAALNAVSTNWVAGYNRTTRKFTIGRTAGTMGLLWNSGANAVTSAGVTLGYAWTNKGPTGAGLFVGDYEVMEETYRVGRIHGVVDLQWETGANGLNGTKRYCFDLLGFDPMRNTGAAQGSWTANSPKCNREQPLLLARNRYGGKREIAIQARHIRSTDTAREVRNRIAALQAEPRAVVSFRSTRVPDLERGRAIQFSPRFDRFVKFTEPYSDGSWAGKKFWVVNVRQNTQAPRFDAEVTCVRA